MRGLLSASLSRELNCSVHPQCRRFEKVEKRVKGMTVWIDPELFLPLRLRYVEADGDVTDLRFENLRVNEGVPSEHFELELPSTVEVRQVELDRSAGRR